MRLSSRLRAPAIAFIRLEDPRDHGVTYHILARKVDDPDAID